MKPQPTFREQLRTKGPWFGAFLFIFIGATVAGWNYNPSSSSRRGGALESAFKGLAYIAGTESTKDVGLMWTGRLLVVVGLALAGYGIWRSLRKRGRQAGPAAVSRPQAAQAQPPQARQLPGMPEPPQPSQQPFPNPFNKRSEP